MTFLLLFQSTCKQLQTLDLSNCRFSTDFLGLPIEELQTGCPNLRVLRLAGCKVRAQQATNKAKVCYMKLQTLDLSNCRFSTDFLGLPIEELQTECPNLRVLRLAGCKVRAQQATNKAKVCFNIKDSL